LRNVEVKLASLSIRIARVIFFPAPMRWLFFQQIRCDAQK